MIADTERLIDGFRGLPAGMDGSKEPPQTPSEAAWYATNVTFRGGNGPKTRPGFREIPTEYWRNPQPLRSLTSIVGDGTTATATTSANHGYDNSDIVTISNATRTTFNGTYRITRTGNTTFTFASTITEPTRTSTSIVGNGTTATVVTTAAHGYATGNTVVITGAVNAGFNGTFTITVTNTTTFTFASAVNATATTQGTINRTITGSCLRDVDASFQDDVVNGTTSRDRMIAVRGATIIQGAIVYQDPRDRNPAQMIIVADGKIYSLNLENASCFLLNSTDEISAGVPVYMTQAEKFLIIQTGNDEPRVYDGYVLRRASYYGSQVIPIGKQMAYGQGRLFVAVNDGAEIIAGDLVFSGTEVSSKIVSSSAANPTVITTASPHGLVTDDLVSISGNSSLIDSTYVATFITDKTLSIPVDVATAGTGGTATKSAAGQDSDLLRFTETTFLAEGGSFSPAGKVGQVTGLTFLPVQDTATGQGDLIAFCERGAVTFAVSVPRKDWKNTEGFQRILFDNIGSTSDSIIPVNGDLFFRSREGNGIRTYRNARAESSNYGQTPLSAEIDPVLKQDTQWMLDGVTFANFDNRLLMTCLPKQYPERAPGAEPDATLLAKPIPTVYTGIAALDFQSVSTGRGKSAAVFDGVWTGLQIYKLIQGVFDGEPRCFAICLHADTTGRRNEIWEITKNDEYDTPVEGPRVINSSIVTKAFDFEDDMSLKKLLRCDLWFDNIGGGGSNTFTCSLAYRPDDYPNFTTWQTFQRNFVTEFLLEDKNLLLDSESFDSSGWTKTRAFVIPNTAANPISGTVDADKLVENTVASNSHFIWRSPTLESGLSYTFSVYAKADERNIIYLRCPTTAVVGSTKTAWFTLSGVAGTVSNASSDVTATMQNVGDGWYRCSMTFATVGAGNAQMSIGLTPTAGVINYTGDGASGVYLWGAQVEQGDAATDYDPDPPQIPNYERGYAPQVRFPTPPRTANLATDVPAYLGHDFTLRVNWAGHAHLGRLMLHGQKVVEAVNGGTL